MCGKLLVNKRMNDAETQNMKSYNDRRALRVW